ncbi:sulfurtransferase [Sporosarcina sp. ACRSM]|uniref:sulfurtransferase n=1 Tax=Sporosarcina sp. ACRSM TaxID=2918216 RepID=UPI001EF698EF|nr:sulfurtransferase [Sporosarcina sp. ACRSM]MCG7333839.1 sulfurtransferase [Sporosarcina sp. ACRSM]
MAEVFKSASEVDFEKTKWIDTRFNLQDEQEGKRKYAESHVAGAIYWDLEEDLSDMTKREGRHPMPAKEALTELFQKSGLSLEDSIIVYDDGGSPFAARAWWLLQYAGFKQAFIALEGFEALKEAGIPVDDRLPQPAPTAVSPQWDETIYASRQYVEQTVEGQTASHLLDARSAARYRGEQEPIDPIAGRIPGALNFDWEQLKQEAVYRLDEAVKSELNQVVAPLEEVTVYCGSGVTAAPLYAMLKQHGYDKVRLYVGSYSDWISRDGNAVERG